MKLLPFWHTFCVYHTSLTSMAPHHRYLKKMEIWVLWHSQWNCHITFQSLISKQKSKIKTKKTENSKANLFLFFFSFFFFVCTKDSTLSAIFKTHKEIKAYREEKIIVKKWCGTHQHTYIIEEDGSHSKHQLREKVVHVKGKSEQSSRIKEINVLKWWTTNKRDDHKTDQKLLIVT